VKDDVPRQHIVETLIGEGQRVGIGLAQAQSEATRSRLVASEVEAGGGTVDRPDGKAVLGEGQWVPADAATDVEHVLRAARSASASALLPPGAAPASRRDLRRCPSLTHRRRRQLLLPHLVVSCALAGIISAKRRCARRNWSPTVISPNGGRRPITDGFTVGKVALKADIRGSCGQAYEWCLAEVRPERLIP